MRIRVKNLLGGGLLLAGLTGSLGACAVLPASATVASERESGAQVSRPALTPEEQYLLGMELAREGGDDARARALFEESYAGGEVRAAYALGWIYFSARGVTQDYVRAFALFREAAEKNLPEAQHMLGLMYGNGLGVAKDADQALVWTQAAAKNGHPEAKAIMDALKQKFGGK